MQTISHVSIEKDNFQVESPMEGSRGLHFLLHRSCSLWAFSEVPKILWGSLMLWGDAAPSPTLDTLPFHVPPSSLGFPLLQASGTESLNGQSRKVVSPGGLRLLQHLPCSLNSLPNITILGQSHGQGRGEKKCPPDKIILGMAGWATPSTVGSGLRLSYVSTAHISTFMFQDEISL